MDKLERELKTLRIQAKKSVKERNHASEKLKNAQAVLRDLRGYREQYHTMSMGYIKLKSDCAKLRRRLTKYDERTVTLSQLQEKGYTVRSDTSVRLPIPLGSPIFVVKSHWLEMFCRGEKSLEIRSRVCHKRIGTKIYLSGNTSGGVGLLKAVVVFGGSRKIVSDEEWKTLRPQHRNTHECRRYGDNTYAYKFQDCKRLDPPIPYHVTGSRIWRKYSPPHQKKEIVDTVRRCR